jgi:dephospho-CoA kinase
MVEPLQALFPGLVEGNFSITSSQSPAYNCIAWAAEDVRVWWWPQPVAHGMYWPEGVPREVSLPAFRSLFTALGYGECENARLEPGFTKIAVFVDRHGEPQHAARQVPSGRWTSKLGELEDIEHALHDLECNDYGSVALVMKRPVPGHKPIIGLIGGIGSGKSHVAAEFAQHGGAIVSGDHLGHQALLRPDVRAQVVQRWDPGILGPDGEIDRRKLGALVFADTGKLRALEAIVLPWIEHGIIEQIAAAQADPAVRFVVLDAAILLEAGWNRFCNRIVYVDAPPALRLARLAQQRGWSDKEVQARTRAQLPLTEKAKRADAAIDNSGSPADLARQVSQLLSKWGIPVAT